MPFLFKMLLSLLVATTLPLAVSSQSLPNHGIPDLTVNVINSLIQITRQIDVFAVLGNHFIMIVGQSSELDAAVVFEQSIYTMESDHVRLKPFTVFTDKWPRLKGVYTKMFIMPDDTGDHLVLVDKGKELALALNLDTGALFNTSEHFSWDLKRNIIALSSTKSLYFFSNDQSNPSMFNWNHLDHPLQDNRTRFEPEITYYICDAGQLANVPQIRVTIGPCNRPVMWHIISGFVNETTAVLVDAANAVFIFSMKVFLSGEAMALTKIDANKFWRRWHDPTTTTPLPSTFTESSVKLTTTATVTTAKHLPHWAMVAIVGGIIFIIMLLGMIIQQNCFKRKNPPEAVKQLSSLKDSTSVNAPENLKSANGPHKTVDGLKENTRQDYKSSGPQVTKTKTTRTKERLKRCKKSGRNRRTSESAKTRPATCSGKFTKKRKKSTGTSMDTKRFYSMSAKRATASSGSSHMPRKMMMIRAPQMLIVNVPKS